MLVKLLLPSLLKPLTTFHHRQLKVPQTHIANLRSLSSSSSADVPQPASADLWSSSSSSSADVSQPATAPSSLPAGVVCSATDPLEDPPEIPSVCTKTRKRRKCGKDII